MSSRLNLSKKKLCILSATPLSIYFFLKPHITALSDKYDVTVVFDISNDAYLGDIGISAKVVSINIARKFNLLQDLKSLYYLIFFFKNNTFDLVISVSPKTGFLTMVAASLSSSARRIHIFQGEFWASKKGLIRFVLKCADFVTAFLAHQLIAVSDSEKQFLVKENITYSDKVTVLGHGSIGGVDIFKYLFNPELKVKIRNDLSIPQNATVALFLGRIVIDKGIFELIKAFLKIYDDCPNLYLMIVGPDEGFIKNELYLQLGKSNDRVRFVGFTRVPEQYISAADFFCLPSYREGFPISVLEASSVGIPSIGSDIYGICDAIETDKTGILVNARDVQALGKAISLLYHNLSLRKYLGENAKVRVHKFFRQDVVVKMYIDYFEKAIENNKLGMIYVISKRTIDIALSLLLIFILAIPILLISIGIIISTEGSIIYWSNRIGKNNTFFLMAKFRSMKIDTPALPTDQLSNPDKYITPFGKFLRKSSLDELPQLWNILIGDMSFVGPRPALFNQKNLIAMRTQTGVNALQPGLTGWAQINGRDQISEDEKIKFDLFYLQNASLSFDFKILWLTLFKVFRGQGVIH